MRWKGKYSERDIDSWSPELQHALKFDPKSAKNFDNGELSNGRLCFTYEV